MPSAFTRKKIITMDVDVSSRSDALARVVDFAASGQGHYVCVSNVHMCIETYNQPDFRQIVNQADLVVADGKPIAWAQRLLNSPKAEQVRGMDLTMDICAYAAEHQLPIGFYGASDATLAAMQKALLQQWPELHIAYAYSPPFRALSCDEQSQIVENINNAGIDILFVGLGCPKQERWMAEHKPQLHCVMLGVGAAFDFIAGNKKHAPKWMQSLGLEWLFRLISEPKRLWKRYLSTNPKFILLFGMQILGRNFQ